MNPETKEKEKILKIATLVFLLKDQKILLPRKTRSIGKGCRNGYGGGVEDGETLLQCAIRELEEECAVIAKENDFEKVAELNFDNITEDGIHWNIVVHTYLLRNWEGEPQETSDGAFTDLEWFEIDKIPAEELMPGTHEWLMPTLSGKKIKVFAKHGPRQMSMLEPQVIEEVIEF